MKLVTVLVMAAVAACSSRAPEPLAGEPAPATPIAGAAARPSAPPATGVPTCAPTRELAIGLTVERVALPDSDGCLTLVRIDPRRWALGVHTAAADGGARPAPRWAADLGLAAVINTSMFGDDQRSVGLLRDAHTVNNDRDNPRMGGFLAFDPVDPLAPPVVLAGRSCPGFDLAELRRRYRGLIQNYRMFDCDGRPLAWVDEKVFSVAAVALDRDGRVVLVHSRTPYQMTRFNQILAAPSLGLVAAMYVEGGPWASLYVSTGGDQVAEMGSFETGFHDDSNREFLDLPNVLGITPRQRAVRD